MPRKYVYHRNKEQVGTGPTATPAVVFLTNEEVAVLVSQKIMSEVGKTGKVKINADVLGERLAAFLHDGHQVNTDEELTELGCQASMLVRHIFGTAMYDGADGVSGWSDAARAELTRIVVSALNPSETGNTQRALDENKLLPKTWLIKGQVSKTLSDLNGEPVDTKILVWAVTENPEMIRNHDIHVRSKALRKTIVTQSKRDLAIIARIPEAAPYAIAASMWTAEVYHQQAIDTAKKVKEPMSLTAAEAFDKEVASLLDDYRKHQAPDTAMKAVSA